MPDLDPEDEAAKERIQNFLHGLVNIQRVWFDDVIHEYWRCYLAAELSYKATVQKQAEADKQNAELMVGMLSLLGGSVVTAVFASTCIKTLAGNAALEVMARHNMNRTFDLYARLASNPAAAFIAGGLVTSGASAASAAVKEPLQKALQFPSAPLPMTAEVMREDMKTFVSRALTVGHDLLTQIMTTKDLKRERRIAAAEQVLQSPLYSRPQRLPTQGLARDIELGMYMKLVLDSDYLVTTRFEVRPNSKDGGMYVTTRAPIGQSALGSSYPTPGAGQRIVVRDPGGTIEKRVNQLYGEFTGKGVNFFVTGLLSSFTNGSTVDTIRKAERTLQALSESRAAMRTMPRSLPA